MKLYKRIISTGLSVLLVTGCAIPALASENITKKSETVYVVLEEDGSVRSQTVSAHLHNENGLSGVTDRTSLTEIENTHDTTAFTQNGEELTWDTEGPDVYYKGVTAREAPIKVRVKYELDGKELPASELAGKSGHMKLTVYLENTETGTIQIDGRSRKVCTPFVTMVAAVIGEGWTDISAEHGKITGAGGTQAAGFVCLPGVRECLEELGSEKLEELEDHLLDQVSIEGEVTGFTAPDIIIACATDTETLRENGLTELDELEGLDDDMNSLREGMDELLDGADRLADGARALENGTAALSAGISALSDGARRLMDGTAQLQTGARQLSAGAAEARDGAAALQEGAGSLASGLSDLKSGAGALSGGISQLQTGSANLSAGLNTLKDQGQPILDGISKLAVGVDTLHTGVAAAAEGAQAFGEALQGAAGNVSPELLPPEDYAAMLQLAGVADPSQLLSAYSGAYYAAAAEAEILNELNANYAKVLSGMQQVSAGMDDLQESVNGAKGLAPGMEAYGKGVAEAASGAARLNAGLNQMSQNLPALMNGVDRLEAGSSQLYAGAGSLSQGNASLAEGAERLAKGTDDLARGVSELISGVQTLNQGALDLQSGASELRKGAEDLNSGLKRFDSEGISKLTGSIDTEKLPALKELTTAMRQRLEDYGSFSGAPKGAKVTTRFVMKTAVKPQETDSQDASQHEEEQREQESLWDRITGLFSK